ncbi:chaplin family protein [Spirillospora sp. NPDC047279]|uniref:chaplin family protein n=1 Tax=Spirillospora sp. NPDC047279 TaxID=3155478 RepID=UPI0033FF603D
MRNWAKNTARAALVAAGIAAVGTTMAGAPAQADTTDGKFSVLGGNQVNAPVSVPLNLSGNSASLFGTAKSKAHTGAHVTNVNQDGGSMLTSGKYSLAGGNQLRAPISVPVNFCGNSIAVAGVTKAACKGAATVTNHDAGSGMMTSGKFSILGGNQGNVPISVPANLCGNAAAAFGVSKAYCEGGAHVLNEGTGSGMMTSGKFSILGGNQANVPVSAPINACGNAASAFGISKAKCQATATVSNIGHSVLPSTQRTADKPQSLPSTQRIAAPSAAGKDVPLPPARQAVTDLVRSIGLPVPTEQDADTFKPGLEMLQGLPVAVAGNPVLR